VSAQNGPDVELTAIQAQASIINAPHSAGDLPVIQVRDLHKSFPPRRRSAADGPTTVLNGVSLGVENGEHVAIIGRSGSGKSTLIRCMNLLETPDSGVVQAGDLTVFDDGMKVGARGLVAFRRTVGMVFQQFNLFPHLTAAENVSLPMVKGVGLPRREALTRAASMLNKVGLGDKMGNFPHELSGGQQQRVAIARAIALQPKVILFDEPTSALDPELVGEVLAVLRELATEGLTMVIVTHELAFAAEVSHRVVFLHEGQIAEEGPPDQVLRNPLNPRTQSFVSQFINN
jgi:ABC-type polar amino acid transport system ATPase subunit